MIPLITMATAGDEGGPLRWQAPTRHRANSGLGAFPARRPALNVHRSAGTQAGGDQAGPKYMHVPAGCASPPALRQGQPGGFQLSELSATRCNAAIRQLPHYTPSSSQLRGCHTVGAGQRQSRGAMECSAKGRRWKKGSGVGRVESRRGERREPKREQQSKQRGTVQAGGTAEGWRCPAEYAHATRQPPGG